MFHLEGLRVVRGPDWKYGDQDGGEGNAGTIFIDEADRKRQSPRPKMISVLWDSGVRAKYRAGPQGSYDLRVVDNSATGAKHQGVACGGDDCSVKEICGIRWQCSTCEINLCTNCFMKEIPHHLEHNQYKRYDNDKITEPPVVNSWSDDGPGSRVKLIGIYAGSKVKLPSRLETGLVLSDPDASGRITVEWSCTKKKVEYERISAKLVVKELVNRGHYHPDALLNLEIPVNSVCAPFSVGDRVRIQPNVRTNQLDLTINQMIGVTGTVESVLDTHILVHFDEKDVMLRLNPAHIRKLNRYSINEVIRIRSDDAQIIGEIHNKFEDESRLIGEIGRVSGIDAINSDLVKIVFDNPEIRKWLDSEITFPSAWLEPFDMPRDQPVFDEELAELDAKVSNLFFDAVSMGDFRKAQLLHTRHGVDLNARRNADGQTALHIACQQGYQDIARLLLDNSSKLSDRADNLGYRPIHYAVLRSDPKILEMLIAAGFELDSRMKSGESALHIAVANEFKDCTSLLIRNGCNVNIQDADGNTPLHVAVQGSYEMIGMLISSGRIDWELRNKERLNVFLSAISTDALKIFEYLWKENRNLLFKWASKPSGSTILHYACMHSNFRVVNLLVGQIKPHQLKSSSASSQLFRKFLEATNSSKSTAFLISCEKKDYVVIELLVQAGVDLKATDRKGNTALILVASSACKDKFPTKELSPSIFKIYGNEQDETNKGLMEEHPILPLFGYLLQKGCSWEAVNNAGKKAADILREKGYSKEAIDVLEATAALWKTWPLGPNGCMGRNGQCDQPAFYRLSCNHKSTYEVCSTCFPLSYKQQKCGCPDEDVITISQLKRKPDELNTLNVLKWIDDGSEQGHIEDQQGNTFIWNKRMRAMNGAIGYRCDKQVVLDGSTKGKCPAVARRFFVNTTDGNPTILLVTPHNHTSSVHRDLLVPSSGEQLEWIILQDVLHLPGQILYC